MKFISLILAVVMASVTSFRPSPSTRPSLAYSRSTSMTLFSTEQPESAMSVDELKAELEMRGVNYDDCISKTELVSRLIESRATGKANTEILDDFATKLGTDEWVDLSGVEDEAMDAMMDDASAGDATLPGGMDPQIMKALARNPEIMRYLQDPKMQEIMKAVMSGGPDALKPYMGDPDAMKMLQALSEVINETGGALGGMGGMMQ